MEFVARVVTLDAYLPSTATEGTFGFDLSKVNCLLPRKMVPLLELATLLVDGGGSYVGLWKMTDGSDPFFATCLRFDTLLSFLLKRLSNEVIFWIFLPRVSCVFCLSI